MASINPQQDYVMVQEDEGNERTEGGLFLPQSASGDGVKFGSIVATGPGHHEYGEFIPVEYEEGQKVAWKDFNELEVRFQGDSYTLIKAENIFATIEE